MPKSVLIDHSFPWADDRPPRTPWNRTVIYECHVKGMTRLHPGVRPELRGTYRGMAEPAVLDHLLGLGVTAVELLPVQHAADEPRLAGLGLTNYWGYNPLGWFAPDERFATAPGRQGDEFRAMVRGLHEAGIEVLLDVVFNHTAEGALPESFYRHDGRGRTPHRRRGPRRSIGGGSRRDDHRRALCGR